MNLHPRLLAQEAKKYFNLLSLNGDSSKTVASAGIIVVKVGLGAAYIASRTARAHIY